MNDGPALPAGTPGGFALSLLREIADRLAVLAETGEPHAIDLTGLPMSKRDCEELEELLGHGEVEAALDVAGETRVWETRYSGVWWIRHMGAGDRVASERIEIVAVPQILCADPADIAAAARRFADDLAERNDTIPQEESVHVPA